MNKAGTNCARLIKIVLFKCDGGSPALERYPGPHKTAVPDSFALIVADKHEEARFLHYITFTANSANDVVICTL